MSARRILVPNEDIKRVIDLARAEGVIVAGLDVGRDYVRTIPPVEGEDSLAQYIGPARRKEKAQGR